MHNFLYPKNNNSDNDTNKSNDGSDNNGMIIIVRMTSWTRI